MAKLSKSAKKSDSPIQGIPQTHIDNRTLFDVTETDWNKHVVIGDTFDSQPMVPYDVVEQVLIENEMLRETLYVNQNYHYNKQIDAMTQRYIGQSTSTVNRLADEIEKATKGAIKKQDAFRMVYGCLTRHFEIKFDKLRLNESKLQYCWRIGALPVVVMCMMMLYNELSYFRSVDFVGTDTFFRGIAKKLDPNKTKSVKKP